MQTDAEGGVGFGELNCFFERGLIDHEAGRGQNPFLMSADDRLIDGTRAAEIVGVNDEAARAETKRHSLAPLHPKQSGTMCAG